MITNWHGKPLADLSRDDLIAALDWCVTELRKHNSEYHHHSREPEEAMRDSVYLVYAHTQYGTYAPGKWYGDKTKGTGQFQRGPVVKEGHPGDLAHFQSLSPEDALRPLRELELLYPCVPGTVINSIG